MIKVEQRSLCTLEENVFATACRLVNLAGAVHHMGGQPFAVGQIFTDHRFSIERFHAVDSLQKLILLIQWAFEAVAQTCFVEKIDDPNAASLRFIRVGRTDAPSRGADAAIAALLLHRLVEQAVVGHGHMRRGGELQPSDVDPVLDQHVEFAKHHFGIDDGS